MITIDNNSGQDPGLPGNYPYHCILPENRFLYTLDGFKVTAFDDCQQAHLEDRISTMLHERSLPYFDTIQSVSPDRYIALIDIGKEFGFEYMMYLSFQREKDFRELWQNHPQLSEQEAGCITSSAAHYACINDGDHTTLQTNSSITQKLLNAYINPALCLMKIGEVDGIDVGHGLFCMTPIQSGELLGEYTGIISTPNTAATHDLEKRDEFAYSCQYPSCDGGTDINACKGGNAMRFINHSPNPNAEFKTIAIQSIYHVIIVRYFFISAQD